MPMISALELLLALSVACCRGAEDDVPAVERHVPELALKAVEGSRLRLLVELPLDGDHHRKLVSADQQTPTRD